MKTNENYNLRLIKLKLKLCECRSVTLDLSLNFEVWYQSATVDGLRSKGDEERLTSEERRATIDG